MKNYIMVLLAVTTLSVISCEKQKTDPARPGKELFKLGEAVLSGGETVKIYAPDSLATGYQPVSIQITQRGNIVKDAQVSLSTMMDMGTMKHSSPSTPPAYNASTQMYEAGAVFTMAGSASEWTLRITIDGEEKNFGVKVKTAPTKVVGTFTATNGNAYVISLVPLKDFQIGINDFQVFISRKVSMMEFMPAEGLNLNFYPEMPSMGHSSPNNVNPVSTGNGMYKGKVNFTMSGDWRLHFAVFADDAVLLDDASIDIRF